MPADYAIVDETQCDSIACEASIWWRGSVRSCVICDSVTQHYFKRLLYECTKQLHYFYIFLVVHYFTACSTVIRIACQVYIVNCFVYFQEMFTLLKSNLSAKQHSNKSSTSTTKLNTKSSEATKGEYTFPEENSTSSSSSKRRRRRKRDARRRFPLLSSGNTSEPEESGGFRSIMRHLRLLDEVERLR